MLYNTETFKLLEQGVSYKAVCVLEGLNELQVDGKVVLLHTDLRKKSDNPCHFKKLLNQLQDAGKLTYQHTMRSYKIELI